MKLISKKDIMIPKGTVFHNIDGEISHHYYDNWSSIIALDKDTCAEIIVSSENKKYFKELKQDDYFFECTSKDKHLKVVPHKG